MTVGGKMFCMFYALAGIPLGLVMFQSIGERLNTFVAYLLQRARQRFGYADVSVSHGSLILIANLFGVLVMTLGAYAFMKFEGWDYFDALYYCFITLTTIGLVLNGKDYRCSC